MNFFMHNQKLATLNTKIKNLIVKKLKIDKKCPFLGNISLRGRIYIGVIKSIAMKSSCIVRIDSLVYLKKYKRFAKRHKNIPSHVSLSLKCSKGDTVLIAQNRYFKKIIRSISKTIRFNVIKIIKHTRN
uniref:Ribosomal protein S11 n=1 Tax=Lotharella vacuolata TaxID=74820 RepID=A0A0H5BQV6_9EUKA|nr:ribosomal protein S11 [Lotharella vacuolata]